MRRPLAKKVFELSTFIYLYGVIDSGLPQSLGSVKLGSLPREVRTLPLEEIAALVSETDEQNFLPTPDDVLTHEKVLETAMAEHTVLPIRFGTVAGSLEDVQVFLKENYRELAANLSQLRGKVEVGVKAFWHKEAVRQEVEREVGQLARLKQELRQAPGRQQEIGLAVGQATEAVIERWKETHVQSFLATLQEYSLKTKINPPISIHMLLNASFLVERDQEPGFRCRVLELSQVYTKKFGIKYAGPLPPYNFVDVRPVLPQR